MTSFHLDFPIPEGGMRATGKERKCQKVGVKVKSLTAEGDFIFSSSGLGCVCGPGTPQSL